MRVCRPWTKCGRFMRERLTCERRAGKRGNLLLTERSYGMIPVDIEGLDRKVHNCDVI